MKKISVIVTCYNHEQYIEQCLRSIFQQSIQNIELIIVNDGSTDCSDEIICRTIKESPFEVTEYIIQENQGSCFARNRGLDSINGEFVLLVDSDNYLRQDYIEKLVSTLEETGKDIAYTSLKNAETQEVINEVPEFSLGRLINANFIDTCSLIRASVINKHRFDLQLNRLFMQDYDFFLSLIHDGAKPIKVTGVYQNYRVIANSVGNRGENRDSRVEWFRVYSYIINKYPEYAGTATSLFSNWYLELNHKYNFSEINLNESTRKIERMSQKLNEQENLLNGKEQVINEAFDKIQQLEKSNQEILNSNIWKFGRIVTLPLRKGKSLIKKVLKPKKSIALQKNEQDNIQLQQIEESNLTTENYKNFILNIEKKVNEEEKLKNTSFSYNPLISILIPVYNVEKKWLQKCIDSIKNQWYLNWEICIADDASTNSETLDYLKDIEDENIKIVFRQTNGHISAATNSALEVATGEFIALVDNDDELAPNALYEVVKSLNENQTLDLIYSDEDKIDKFGNRYDSHFKPDWSPDLILNQNYISHLGVYRTEIARKIGGFRLGYEGAQDHDFLLRFTEEIPAKNIYHISKILYHWRAIEGSTALESEEKNYAFDKGIKAVQDALTRRNIAGRVKAGKYLGLYDIKYDLIEEALVSIIIPTKDGYEDLKLCLESIVFKSMYKNYEIIIADNGSEDYRVIKLFDEYKKKLKDRFKVVRLDIPFNYSRINNLAVKESTGEYLLFLNNDTSVISGDWIETMLGFAQFDRIGCVGAKLLYFDDTIQHGGVILGVGGVAGHTFLNENRDEPGYFSRLCTDYNYTVVTAACLMVSRKDFDLVDGFDETLEVAFNDVDLCIRIYQLGRNNVWAHNAELYHYESKSRGYEDTLEKKERFNGEMKKMCEKHEEILQLDPAYNVNFSLNATPFTLIGR